jgi:Mrp family chromosome partitioning ATPase
MFVLDRRDVRIHDAADVGRLLELPVLLSLPRRAFRQPGLAAVKSRTGQRFAELASALTALLGPGRQIVLVAGTDPGRAGGVIAANLAAALARASRDVVLVCAGPGEAAAPEMLGVRARRGLAEVLAGRATVREVARGPAELPGLLVITPGAEPPGPAGPLPRDTARALTSQLRRDAEYVVIDAPAAADDADAFPLAEYADAAVIAVEAARTSRAAADECIRQIRQLRTPVLGAAVLTAVSPRSGGHPAGHGLPRRSRLAGVPG